MTELYSPSLRRRYHASIKAGAKQTSKLWPPGCGGATNAYLVLVGPSPGGSSGAKRYPRNQGPEAMSFRWGSHRNARWTRLCATILGDECRARTLTALLNLDWRHSTNEWAISDARLRTGWTNRIWPLLAEVRPRIVCALTNRVWDVITNSREGACEVAKCRFKLAREPLWLTIPGCGFQTLLVKSNHPSRFLSNKQIDQLGRACHSLIIDMT
jgi:hypothetical protein